MESLRVRKFKWQGIDLSEYSDDIDVLKQKKKELMKLGFKKSTTNFCLDSDENYFTYTYKIKNSYLYAIISVNAKSRECSIDLVQDNELPYPPFYVSAYDKNCEQMINIHKELLRVLRKLNIKEVKKHGNNKQRGKMH